MKIPSPRESFSHLVYELVFLACVAAALLALAGMVHGLFWVLSVITGEATPFWARWLINGCEILLAVFFALVGFSLHFTTLGKFIKGTWAEWLKKAEQQRIEQENRSIVIGVQPPAPIAQEAGEDNDS